MTTGFKSIDSKVSDRSSQYLNAVRQDRKRILTSTVSLLGKNAPDHNLKKPEQEVALRSKISQSLGLMK